jgi:hypothetical protein
MRDKSKPRRPIAAVGIKPLRVAGTDLRARVSDDVMSERFGDEVVLLNLKTNRFFSLNRTGARLWELLVSGERLGAIEEQLRREFEVDPAELAADVQRMLASMQDEQLVRLEEG